MLKAVIFDLDGVIADSHPIHEAAWKTLLIEQGLDSTTLDLDFLYAGHPRREILRHYLGSIKSPEMKRLGRRKDELYAVAAHELKTKPGILRVLSELNSAGILCALATSAGRTRAHESLEQFSITKEFSLIVAGEDAAVAKPAPEIFLLAAKKLDVMSNECVVVEDSVAGVVGARAARMKCVGYALPRFAAALAEAGADDVISDFPEDSPTYFTHLVGSNGTQRLALQRGSPPARGR